MAGLVRLILILMALISSIEFSAAQQAAAPKQTIKVATRIIPPFVIQDSNAALSGFSIDLWRALARDMRVEFDFVVKPSVPELLAEVADGRAQVAIAAISVTADREKAFDFSQPMFDAGLQIMISADRASSGGFASFMTLLKSPALLEMLGILLVLIILPAPVIWLLERRHEGSIAYNKSGVGGFFNSIWWSASTLGAQAPEMPIRPIGKFIAVIWMFVSVIFISFFTATVTTALTVKQLEQSITGPQDLVSKNVATTAGSTGAAFLRQLNINALEVPQVEQAFEALQDGRVQAVVGDAPVLLYHTSHDGKGKVQMAGPIFRPENYGILFPSESPLRKQVNEALLRLKENGEYRSLYRKWFAVEAIEKD